MRVSVSSPPPQSGRSGIVSIHQIRGDRERTCGAHCFLRPGNCLKRRVTFGRACDIRRSLRQYNLRFRHSHPLHGKRRIHRDNQRHRIGVRYVLRSAYHNPPCNKSRLFTCRQHFGQIIDRRIRIRSSHAFNKRGYIIIMVIAGLVISNRLLLNTL